MRSPLLQNALWYFSLCSRPHPDVSVTKCFQRRTAEFYTDSLFWLMRCKPDIHCRHKRIRRHTLQFMRKGKKKTSKESVSPLYKLSQAFSFSQTDWKIEWSRKVFWSTSSVFIYIFFLNRLCCSARCDRSDQYRNVDVWVLCLSWIEMHEGTISREVKHVTEMREAALYHSNVRKREHTIKVCI